MHVSFDDDVHSTDAIKWDFNVLVSTPVALKSHVIAKLERFEVFVAFSEDEILVLFEARDNFERFRSLLP